MIELLSWSALLWLERGALKLPAFLVLHAGACVLAARVLGRKLSEERAMAELRTQALLFALTFFLPFAGLPGLVACIALYRPPRRSGPEAYEFFELPPLPYRARPHRADLLDTDFNLAAIVGGSQEVDPRMRALLAAGKQPGGIGVPILQGALRDGVDEVRLLAHSLLETRERGLYGALAADTAALAQAPEAQRPRLHARQAFLSWELVYTGLASGDVAAHLLSEALGHAEAACAREEDAGLRLLMGRIHLHRGDAASAREALRRALDLGFAPHLVLPYLAEAAYLLGRRDELTDCARRLRTDSPDPSPIAEFWS